MSTLVLLLHRDSYSLVRSTPTPLVGCTPFVVFIFKNRVYSPHVQCGIQHPPHLWVLLLFRKVLRHGPQFLGPGTVPLLRLQNGVTVLPGGELALPRGLSVNVALQTQKCVLRGIQVARAAAHLRQSGDGVPPFPVKVGVFRGVVPAVAQVGGGAVQVADLQHGGETDGFLFVVGTDFVFVTVAVVWVCGLLLLLGRRLIRGGNHRRRRPYGLAARG